MDFVPAGHIGKCVVPRIAKQSVVTIVSINCIEIIRCCTCRVYYSSKIKEAADKGDKYAHSVIIDLGTKLGAALATVSNILDISTYIIGGGVAGFGKPLLDSIKNSLTSRVIKPIKPRVKILPAKLKNDAGIKGASALVFHGY
ncbi:MAG: ROK family protein [Bacteroidetes bacterium]|nr:ROK family protein [Bacteroidota bacterium]